MVRSGVDGADRALLSVVENEGIAVRFEGVVIASGDGIFAEAAALFAGCGLSVTVVSRERALYAAPPFGGCMCSYLQPA